MKLYGFFRSSAAYRVRIALHLKGIGYETAPVHLRRNGGEHRALGYAALNPERLVPALATDGRVLTQSLAIIEYLEEAHPTPPLLPRDAADRAWVRALALHVACEIHPLNNLRVLQHLEGQVGLDEQRKKEWIQHWIEDGFSAIEARLTNDGLSGTCCFGDVPTLADCALVPQVANARRFEVDLNVYPALNRIATYLESLPAFQNAAPDQQIDAE